MLQECLKSICIVFYESLCCQIFMNTFFKRRSRSKINEYISLVLLTFVILMSVVSTVFDNQYIMRIIEVICILFIFTMIFYKGKLLMKLFLSITYYALLFSVDYVCMVVVESLIEDYLLYNTVVQVIVVLLCKTVLLIVVLILNRRYFKSKDIRVKSYEWILMMCFPVLSIAILAFLLLTFRENSNSAGYLALSFGICVMNVAMFILLRIISEREEQISQVELINAGNRERVQAYNELKSEYDNQKSLLHDYANQVGCIQGLINEKNHTEAEKYADKLAGMLSNGMKVINVNNAVINVILNQKHRLAQSKGIGMIFYINDMSNVWIDDNDAVILLTNLLDNAIEGCDKASNNRVIKVNMVLEKKQLIISVQNTVHKTICINNNSICTDKSDKKNHGYGLKNIKLITEKYDGMETMRCESGWFYHTIIVPKID